MTRLIGTCCALQAEVAAAVSSKIPFCEASLSILPSILHVTGPWIARTKEPSTQPKKWLPIVREVDKGRAPPLVLPELLQEAYACVGRIKREEDEAGWNQSAFHQAREERRSYLTSADCPLEWRPPQEHDIHFGPLTLPNGEINIAGAEYSSVPTRAMIVSGFPVGPDYIWACMHYLAGKPSLAANC